MLVNEAEIDPELFRKRLLALQRELRQLEASGAEAAQTVTLDQSRVGRLSRMDALQAQAMSSEANRRRKIELQRIAAALRRIEEDDYGYCLSCGEPINPKRLEIDPAAPHCISCAEQSN